jgi:hypothetical protein
METIMSKLIDLGRVSTETKSKFYSLNLADGAPAPGVECLKNSQQPFVEVILSNTEPEKLPNPYTLTHCREIS